MKWMKCKCGAKFPYSKAQSLLACPMCQRVWPESLTSWEAPPPFATHEFGSGDHTKVFAGALRALADQMEREGEDDVVGGVFCVSIHPTGCAVIAALHPELADKAKLAFARAIHLGMVRVLADEQDGPNEDELAEFNGLMGSMLTSMKGGDA